MTFGFAKRLDLQTYEAMYAVLFLPGYVTLLRPSPGPRYRVELTFHRYVYRLLRETGEQAGERQTLRGASRTTCVCRGYLGLFLGSDLLFGFCFGTQFV